MVLEDLLGTRSKVRILRQLCLSQEDGTDDLSVDEMAQATGLSTGTLVPALRQLHASKIVQVRPDGRTRRIRIDHSHPAVPLLRSTFRAEMAFLQSTADNLVAALPKGQTRYAAWWFAPEEDSERRHAPWLLAIVEDQPVALEAMIEAGADAATFELKILDEPGAAAAVRGADDRYRRLIEMGRVVYVDKKWAGG